MTAPALLWLRQDLRLTDNPALAAAIASGRPILAVYIHDEASPGLRPLGGAARWWLARSLASLGAAFERLGGRLVLRRGAAGAVIEALIAESGAKAVYWNRLYDPASIARDREIKSALTARGIEVISLNASLLSEPWVLTTQSGGPFKVFTPFWRKLQTSLVVPPVMPAPRKIAVDPRPIRSDKLEEWELYPAKNQPDWATPFALHWQPGEAGALERLSHFLRRNLADYVEQRDRPDRPGTARLSPALHFGEIGPRQIWQSIAAALRRNPARYRQGADVFLRELGWREFTHHLLFHWPDLPTRNWRPAFDRFPWRQDAVGLAAWQKGRTGYPIVDAGMRELRQSGWMHNRVRMIVASFLCKDLLVDWREGESWFWDNLLDADLAQNAASWQWVAGSGADAAPYFRIFNPILQGRKFDPSGAYIRRWVPELARLADDAIHCPWEVPARDLALAGIRLGSTYPRPVVEHAGARARALSAYREIAG